MRDGIPDWSHTRTIGLAAAALATAVVVIACGKAPDDRKQTSSAPAASAPVAPPAPAVAKPTRDVCALLSIQEASEITGLPVERAEKTADGCAWFANAAAQREKAQSTVAGTFQQLNKQEPATAEDAARSMETMLKGMIGAAAPPGGPLFAVTVQSENADQGEAILKGTVGVVGAGTPAQKLEAVEGLGDRAYWGPAGSFLLVRKGPVLLNLGLSRFSGSREQSIALARKMISRL